MPLLCIRKNFVGVSEKCLLREDGDYVGIDTGTVYPAATHRHSPQLQARIVAVDEVNRTGMYHLCQEWSDESEENARSWKQRYVGCCVTVEEAHRMGELIIYRCVELGNYWSGDEIALVKEDSPMDASEATALTEAGRQIETLQRQNAELRSELAELRAKAVTYEDRYLIEWAVEVLEGRGIFKLRPNQGFRLRLLLARLKEGSE